MFNFWNKAIYKLWSPVYDRIFNSGSFLKAREQLFKEVILKEGTKILFVGVGTGVDLERIDIRKYKITAIDFSPDMLRKAKNKFESSTIRFIEMNAEEMSFEDETFDYVVASLILSVVPSAERCFQEIIRVTKKNGQIIVFDKFVPTGKKLSVTKKLIRPLISILGTDIGLSFETIFNKYNHVLQLVADKPVMFNGMYRRISLRKFRNNTSF